jgi:hypothetical protein
MNQVHASTLLLLNSWLQIVRCLVLWQYLLLTFCHAFAPYFVFLVMSQYLVRNQKDQCSTVIHNNEHCQNPC